MLGNIDLRVSARATYYCITDTVHVSRTIAPLAAQIPCYTCRKVGLQALGITQWSTKNKLIIAYISLVFFVQFKLT